MLHDLIKTWSSVELFAQYVDEGGLCMWKLNEYHGENVLILSSSGFANVMGFRSELVQSLHLVKNTDDDHCFSLVKGIIQIQQWITGDDVDREHYNRDNQQTSK